MSGMPRTRIPNAIRSTGRILGTGLAVLLLGAGAKMILQRRRERRSPSFPADATPDEPPSQTKSPS